MSFVPPELELREIADRGLAGQEPASPHFPKKHAEAHHVSASTPLSQASTAPTTPNMQFRLPSLHLDGHDFDEDHFPLLTRQLSIPEEPEEGSGFESAETLEDALRNVQQIYERKYGRIEDDETTGTDEGAKNSQDHGVCHWLTASKAGAAKKKALDLKVDKLEQKLAEVKQLYQQKYGKDADEEDTDDVQYDADGTPWIQISGTGSPRDLRVERLEQMLSAVKGLYSEKYGRDVDTEYDDDGTAWKVTEGTGVPRDCRVERLEQKLAEVKQLYQQKYGNDVDQEDVDVQYDADGTPWIQISGTGSPRDLRVERLEQMLSTVKGLYSEKYGRDVDTEYDDDGTAWKVTEGTGVPRDCRVERLEQKLAEVKQLYQQKYGNDVDQDETDETFFGDFAYDADGTLWIRSITTGPLRSLPSEHALGEMLEEVKDLYQKRFGNKAEETAAQSWSDKDGTPWVEISDQSASSSQGTSFKGTCSLQ